MSNLCELFQERKFQEFIDAINEGANVKYVYLDGNTILHEIMSFVYYLVSFHKIKIDDIFNLITLVIKNGCDINVKDYQGNTPLHLAADPRYMSNVQKTLCKFLIDNGANLLIKNKYNKTPYEHSKFFITRDECEYEGDIKVIKFLKKETKKMSKKCKLNFLIGLDDKLGQNSSLLKYSNFNLFERQTLPIIFNYAFDN